MVDEPITIRSYRRIFHVDRRLYRIQDWTIPVPGGVPLLAVAYFAATLVAVLIAGGLPGLEQLLGLLSPPLRYVVLPLAVAVLGTQIAPDGRRAHRFAADWLALHVRRRRRSAGRPIALEDEPHEWQAILPVGRDAHGPQLMPGRVTGPATVLFADDVEVTQPRRARGAVRARPAGRGTGRGQRTRLDDVVDLSDGQHLEITPR